VYILIREKSYLVPRFSFDLNLILRFLISRIKSLGFAYVSNRSLCYFTVKVNGLPSTTCVSFNMSASTSTTLISATSYIYIYILRKKKKPLRQLSKQNSTPRLTPHYQSSSNRQSSSTKTTKKVRSVASVTKNYLGFFFLIFFRNKLKKLKTSHSQKQNKKSQKHKERDWNILEPLQP